MSKNMTRKGLAWGSGLALVLAGFVATPPANAAPALILEPLLGTEYGQIEDETFTLKVYGNSEFLASNGSFIRFKVQNDGAATFSNFAINGVTLDDDFSDGGDDYAGGTNNNGNSIKYTGLSTGTVATVGTTDGASAVMGLGTSRDTLATADTVLMTSPSTFSFTNGDIPAAGSAKLMVTAWVDVDNDGVMDSGELASPTATVTYYSYTSTSIRPAISGQPIKGDTTSLFTFDLGPVNEAQVTLGKIGAEILNNSSATPDVGVSGGIYKSNTSPAVTLNTAGTAFRVTVENEPASDGTEVAFDTTGAGSKFTLSVLYDSNGTAPVTGDKVGGANSASYTYSVLTAVRGSSASDTTADVVPSANAVRGATAADALVRRNSEFKVALTVEDSDGDPLSGVATSVTISTSGALSTSRYLTVNGTNYTSSAALADLVVRGTSAADGTSAVTILPTGFSADDTITVVFQGEGTTTYTVVTTQKNASVSMNYVLGNEAANAGYDPSIAPGGTHTVAIAVADQFGVAPANGTYTVTTARAATSGTAARTTAASWALSTPVVDGVATINITDNGAGAGSDTVTSTLVGANASATTVAFDLIYSTTNAPAAITLTDNWNPLADSPVQRNATSAYTWHPYLAGGKAAPTVTNNFDLNALTWAASDRTYTVSGVVTNGSNIGVEGVPVTVSATGLTFAFTDGNGKTIYKRDSIVVPTAQGGTYSVAVYSDATGGEVTITATAGSLSKTQKVNFVAGATSNFTISVPATSDAGKTADVIITATDANGNKVQGAAVVLSSTGPGYLINTSGTTLSDGTFSTKLLLGSNDSGTAVIKVTMTIAGVSTTKTAEIKVGSAAGKVNVGSFNGKLVVYAAGLNGARISWKVGGNWGSAVATSNYSVFNRPTPRAGVTVSVDIYVNGVKTLTKSVLTR